jgi:uncharacterized membrane protein YeaQ/YmgE (transglycosylase-associated protein family)
MNFIIWTVIGGAIGWLASMVLHTDSEQGTLTDIVVGIVGASAGGALLSSLSSGGVNDDFNLTSLMLCCLGAVILLALTNLIRRSRAR